jgi:hypothetical protein
MSMEIRGIIDHNWAKNMKKEDIKLALQLLGDPNARKPVLAKINEYILYQAYISYGKSTFWYSNVGPTGSYKGLWVRYGGHDVCMTPSGIVYGNKHAHEFNAQVRKLSREVENIAKMISVYGRIDKEIYERGGIKKRNISICVNKQNKLELTSKIQV